MNFAQRLVPHKGRGKKKDRKEARIRKLSTNEI